MYIEAFRKVGTVGSTLDLPINWESLKTLITIKYWDSDPTAGSAVPVVPTAGSAVITARLVVNGKYVDITDGTFDCTVVRSRASYIGNITDLRVVPSSIVGAAYYEIYAVSHGEFE